MSRAEKLFEAIGLVRDEYIEEAADARAVRTASHWRQWGTLAATLVLVAGLGMAATTQLRGCGAKESSAEITADTAAPENGSMQESTTTDSASDNATGSSSGSMEENAVTEDSATDGGMTEAPMDSIGTELAALTVVGGQWTVDRHTLVHVDEMVTVTDAYTVTNDGDTVQEMEEKPVDPGETVEIDRVTNAMGEAFVLLPVENVTPGTWTVEITAADGYAVEGLTEGELTWENHAFTVLQP